MWRSSSVFVLLALAGTACNLDSRPYDRCTDAAPVRAYGDPLPPGWDAVWYIPPAYVYDDYATGGGAYYDETTGVTYPDDSTNTDPGTSDGWDVPDTSSDPPVDTSGSSSSSSGSSDDGWDEPDDAKSSDVQTKAIVAQDVPAGCYACQVICVNGNDAFTTTGASSRSYETACHNAEHRLARSHQITTCANAARISRSP